MLTVNELFSGIGAQVAALKRLGIDYEIVGVSEIDKYAIQSYEAINGQTRNYGDISQIPALDYADLWTYSSPCTDFSTAGKQEGLYKADGSLTRSGLLLHVERLLTTAIQQGNQPKFLLMENVKGLVSKKFKPDFQRWLDTLEKLGYNNYWKVLNAKDYGIPQNRERVFVVSIRKDLEQGFNFPAVVPLEKCLKDVLEKDVEEKYYLNGERVEKLIKYLVGRNISNTIRCGGRESKDIKHTWDIVAIPVNLDKDGNSRALCNNYSKQCVDNILGLKGYGCTGVIELVIATSRGRNPDNPSDRTAGAPTEQRLEINSTGCTNTLTTVQKDNLVLIQNPHGFNKGGVHELAPTLTSGGSYQENNYVVNQVGSLTDKNHQQDRVYSPEGLSPVLSTMATGGNLQPKIINNYRIRKLTPLECWRLMGFTDLEFDLAQMSGVSNSQLYKQAGNSIVVDVLVGIFKELLK